MTWFSSCTTYSPAPHISYRKSIGRRMILPGKNPSDLNRLDLVEILQVPSPQPNPILRSTIRLDLPLTPTTESNTTSPIKGTFLMMVRDATPCLTSSVSFSSIRSEKKTINVAGCAVILLKNDYPLSLYQNLSWPNRDSSFMIR